MLCAAVLSSTANLQAQKSEVNNISLVHGAWADGSGWRGVYDNLVRDGFNVSIVQEPEASFKGLWCKRSIRSAMMDGCRDSYLSRNCSRVGISIERSWSYAFVGI